MRAPFVVCLLTAALLSPPRGAAAACEDSTPRKLGTVDGVAFYVQRHELSLGAQSVSWAAQNLTNHELYVRFTKEYYSGHALVKRVSGSVLLEPGETLRGGTFVGDDLALNDVLFTDDELRGGGCVDNVRIEEIRVEDRTAKAMAEARAEEAAERAAEAQRAREAALIAQQEAAQRRIAEAEARAEAMRRQAAETQARREAELEEAQAEAEARRAALQEEIARREAAALAQYEAQMALARSIGEFANELNAMFERQRLEREAREAREEAAREAAELRAEIRAEQEAIQREIQAAREEEARMRAEAEAEAARAREEAAFWARPADLPAVDGRVLEFAVRVSDATDRSLLQDGEFGPAVERVHVSSTFRHPPAYDEVAVPVACRLRGGPGVDVVREGQMIVVAGEERTTVGMAFAGAELGNPTGDTYHVACSHEGRVFGQSRFTIVARAEVDRRLAVQQARRAEEARIAAEAAARAEAERRKEEARIAEEARQRRLAWLPDLDDDVWHRTIAARVAVPLSPWGAAGNGYGLSIGHVFGLHGEIGAEVSWLRLRREDAVLGFDDDQPGLIQAEVNGGARVLHWPSESSITGWQLVELAAGLGAGLGLGPKQGAPVAWTGPYVAQTFSASGFFLRLQATQPIVGSGLHWTRGSLSLGRSW